MMRRGFLFIVLLVVGGQVSAQSFKKYSELGLFGGVSYYMGDLNLGKQFFMPSFAGGLVFKHNYNARWAWRISALYGNVQADDSRSEMPSQIQRNLSFRSQVIEFSPMLEFNFFPYEVGNLNRPATPYIFGGFALFRFNPKAEYQGDWVALQPLGTEGQGTVLFPDRKEYSLINATFPFGIGFKFHAGRLALAIEWGLRKTFTDYLDDVSTTYVDPDLLYATNGVLAALIADRSVVNPGEINTGRQRGNPSNKDWYSFAGITLSYKLSRKESVCPAYQ
jgi:hypothetical protein